jgi:hypothetical protein
MGGVFVTCALALFGAPGRAEVAVGLEEPSVFVFGVGGFELFGIADAALHLAVVVAMVRVGPEIKVVVVEIRGGCEAFRCSIVVVVVVVVVDFW